AAKIAVPNGMQISYRVVYKAVDPSGAILLSAPSPRHIVQNDTGEDRDVRVRLFVPRWLGTSQYRKVLPDWSVLLFRTAASAIDTDPGDEHFLVREVGVNTDDWLDFIDDLDEAFLGEPLYTNPTEETIGKANYPPPFAHDIETYRGHTFYARTRQPHEVTIRFKDLTRGSPVIDVTRGSESYQISASLITSKSTTAQNLYETARRLALI